jgi:hypothetical protein
MDTRAYSGKHELGYRDEDATDALIADAEDLFAIYVKLGRFRSQGVEVRLPVTTM